MNRVKLLLVVFLLILGVPAAVYGLPLMLAEFGPNDFRISDMGIDGDTNSSYRANDTDIAYSKMDNQYLVVWETGDSGLAVGEDEIWGQFISNNGLETGANDFRISFQGGTGDPLVDANVPAIVWNSDDNQYIVVWQGDRIAGEDEIYGQILAGNGSSIGGNFQISDIGIDGDSTLDGTDVDVVYNSIDQEYLVIWEADDVVNGQVEIFGRRVSPTGVLLAADFQISQTNPGSDGFEPAVVWNSVDNQYLVAFRSDKSVAGKNEIYGQLLNNLGVEIGANDFLIGTNGPALDIGFDAIVPDVAYSEIDNRYLISWQGDNVAVGEDEIFGQFVEANGSFFGGNFRISFMGVDGDSSVNAEEPALVWNEDNNEYIVVWNGDVVAGEEEIFAQQLSGTGVAVGTVIRLSDMGPDGDIAYDAFDPAVVFNTTDNDYLVVWEGDDNIAPLIDEEDEIFGQLFDAGVPVAVTVSQWETVVERNQQWIWVAILGFLTIGIIMIRNKFSLVPAKANQ